MSTYLELPPGGIIEVPTASALPTGESSTVYLVQDTGMFYYWDKSASAWSPTAATLSSSSAGDTDSVDNTVTLGKIYSDVKISTNAASAGNKKATTTIQSTSSKGLHVEIPVGNLTEATSSVLTIGSGTGAVVGTGTTIAVTKADVSHDGYISQGDWGIFNGKQNALTFGNLSETTSSVLTFAGATGAVIGSGATITVTKADASHDGYIAQADFSTFAAKEPAITATTTADFYRGDKSFQQLNMAALTPKTDGSSITSGIGQEITSSVSSASATGIGATAEWGDVTSITITAGLWSISGVVGFNENGATLTDSMCCGIKSTTGNSVPAFGDYCQYNELISSTADLIAPIPTVAVNLGTGGATYYLKTKFTYTAGAPKHYGKITARRIG